MIKFVNQYKCSKEQEINFTKEFPILNYQQNE